MFGCIHQDRMIKAYESMKPLIEKLNHGWFFNLQDDHNEVKELMEKIFLCFGKCLDMEKEAEYIINRHTLRG